MINDRVRTSPEPWPISKLLQEKKYDKIVLQPDFQREYVWKGDKMKEELIKSIMLGYPLGVFTMWRIDSKYEVVDGLQRLETIFQFYKCNKTQFYKLSKDISLEIISAFSEEIREEAHRGDKNAKIIITNYDRKPIVTTLLTKDKMTAGLLSTFTSYPISINIISEASAKNIKSYFRVVQNQEKLKAGEIINSIDNNWIKEIINSKETKLCIKESLQIIRFNNTRNDFLKFAILFLGILERKIKFGTTDKIISQYAIKLPESINEFYKERLTILVHSICENNFQDIQTDRSLNKFSMKMLFALSIWHPHLISVERISDTVQKLYFISEHQSKINSLNTNRIEEVKALIFYDDLKILSRLARSSQSIENVEKATKSLSKIISSLESKHIQDYYKFNKNPKYLDKYMRYPLKYW